MRTLDEGSPSVFAVGTSGTIAASSPTGNAGGIAVA
jgi:hypothetical protein